MRSRQRHSRRAVWCLGLAAAALLLGIRAFGLPQQSAGQTPQQPPTFRSGASLVRVDVAVLDRKGTPVPSLTAGDFEVQEDGVPQTIQSFKFVQASGQREPGDDELLAIRSPEHAAAEAARDDVRVFLIFWDEYHIDQFESAIRGREALGRFVATAFGPTDLVGLMDPLTPVSAIRFTRQWSDLVLDVRKLRGRLGVYIPTRSAMEDAQLARGGDIRRLRAEVTVSALKAAAVYLGTLREGRKSIIFVSQGLRALERDQQALLIDAVRAANESNTAIYTLDPRGLSSRSAADSLWILAENTGAKAIVNSNSLDEPLRQVVKDASAFYLLGYSSARNPADGRFHQIKVRVKKAGLEVLARKGYWAPSPTAIAEGRRAAAEATPPDDVAKAFEDLTPSTARRLVDLWTGASRAADGRTMLTVTWSARPLAADGSGRPAVVAVTARGADGATVYEGRISDRPVSFPVRTGSVQLQLSVRDEADEIIDSETRTISVPDFAASPFTWSSPILLRARTPLELKALASDPDAIPFAGREFSRGDRLLVRLCLYGDENASAAVSARLTGKNGRDLVPLPITRIVGRSGAFEIDLPVSSFAPGDYVIRVGATRERDHAERLVAIRVK